MVLQKGDTIGIIALAGNCEEKALLMAKSNLEKLGYRVKLSSNILDQHMYLAGSDEKKVEELHNFFLDKNIKLILNARGGYGSIRLLDLINYDIIQNNQKPFCGFSDITALLLMIYKKTGYITYHSPMACSDFGNKTPLSYTLDKFFEAVNNDNFEFIVNKIYKAGSTQGIIWGGNLSTVTSLCGQDFIPDEDFIFFAEDLNEPVYKIDKMFQQLFNIKEFKNHCKGLILGDFLNVENSTLLEEFFINLSKKNKMPIVQLLNITHKKKKITLPIGAKCVLNGKKIEITKNIKTVPLPIEIH